MSNIPSIYISYIRLLSKFQPKRTRSSVWNACGRDRVRGFYGMERGEWKEKNGKRRMKEEHGKRRIMVGEFR